MAAASPPMRTDLRVGENEANEGRWQDEQVARNAGALSVVSIGRVGFA